MPTARPDLRVLIIDDEAENRAVLREHLGQVKDWAVKHVEAEDAAAALSALKENLFDAAFLDYKLPDLDGLKLLKQIRQLHPKVAVIMLSSWGSEKVAVEAMRSGAIDYLSRDDLRTTDMGLLLHRALEIQDLQFQNTELRQVNRMKDEFISSVSHELRTPLAVILGYAKTLEDQELGPVTPAQRKAVEAIRRRGERLLEMLNRLLAFKDSSEGRQQAVLRPCDLTSFFRELSQQKRADSTAKETTLSFSLPSEPVWALADPPRLGEVVDGLLSNAVKFSPEKSAVALSVESHGAKEIWIRVRDQGRGIPPDALPRLFEGFFHTDSELTREVEGLGIGLALAKQIVELHGGRIWLESDGPGRGTTAVVALPAVDPGRSEITVEKESRVDKKRILVIEDNADILEIIRLFLANFSENIVLTTTDRGQRGLEMVSKDKYDLLILDLIMPGLSGFDILERMEKLPDGKRPPTLILSGHSEAAKRAVAGGAQGYLLKPFTKEDFIARVLELLGMERRKRPR